MASYGIIDKLSFGYTGNQLKYVNDAAPDIALSSSADFKNNSNTTNAEYTFNKNGAMTKDLNRGTLIAYNSLSLPQQVDIKSPVAEARSTYTYTASGVKLRVSNKWNPGYSTTPIMGTDITPTTLTSSKVTDYVGNKIYEDGILKRILTDNGYIEGNTYYFYIKDHLGNNRIVANSSGSVIQSTQYYPFGMAFGESTTTEQGKQDFKYNGKELDREHELNQYDYAARYYDPGYGRFTTIDPLAEKFYSWSPYVYCLNNPVKLVDKDGKRPDFPPGAFGSPESITASAINQKVAPKQIQAATPAAVGTNIGATYITKDGLGFSGSYSQTYLTRGQDEGTLNTYVKGASVIGKSGFSVAGGIEASFYRSEDSFLFNAQSLEGKSDDISITIGGKVFGITLTKSTAVTQDGVVIDTYGIQFGASAGSAKNPVQGYTIGKGSTTQIQGANDSDKKKQERVNYKEKRDQKQKEIGNSLWNWLSK